jgi:acetyltransferase-like isoleucine patch superfamily enzyme
MKKILKFLLVPIFRSFCKKVKGKNNKIILRNSNLRNLKVFIDGNDNNVIIDTIKYWTGQIIIKGNHCSVEIGENTINSGTGQIIIKGNHCSVKIGENTVSSGAVNFVCAGENNHIKIGKDCLFADNIDIWASDTHSIFDENGKFINKEKDVVIGDNVWVGKGVKILKGVTIGKGSVIGMGTILTKNVGEKELVIGNPQRVIKSNISWSKDYPNVEEM